MQSLLFLCHAAAGAIIITAAAQSAQRTASASSIRRNSPLHLRRARRWLRRSLETVAGQTTFEHIGLPQAAQVVSERMLSAPADVIGFSLRTSCPDSLSHLKASTVAERAHSSSCLLACCVSAGLMCC